jgi:hypothetical protein
MADLSSAALRRAQSAAGGLSWLAKQERLFINA